MAGEFRENLQVPPDSPACVKPANDIPHSLMDEYFKAKDAPGTKVETGNFTEKLTLPDGTQYRSDYTLDDMTITNLTTHQADKFIGLYRSESRFVTRDTDSNSLQVIASLDHDGKVTDEIGQRSKDGVVISYFHDAFKADGNASRVQCADSKGHVNYDKSF